MMSQTLEQSLVLRDGSFTEVSSPHQDVIASGEEVGQVPSCRLLARRPPGWRFKECSARISLADFSSRTKSFPSWPIGETFFSWPPCSPRRSCAWQP